MSVRRLAEKQPESFAFTAENEAWADRQIAKYPEGRQASAVLSLLWRAQKQNDYWLPKPAIEEVAKKLGMPFIRVLEVATFYTMFNLEPVGRFFVQMCGTTPCQLSGSDGIKAVLQKRIGPQRKVTEDGNFSWLEVECLGACCNAPMVQINDDYYEDLTPETFEALLDDLAAGRPVTVGPQNGRRTSEPAGELTSLTTWYGTDGKSGPGFPDREPANQNAPARKAPEDEKRGGTQEDEGTKGNEPAEPSQARHEQEDRKSAAMPDKEENTGAKRTEPSVSGKAQKSRKATQRKAKGGEAPDEPAATPGHEPDEDD